MVRLCDHVAYLNHDLDDAIRAGILEERAVPEAILERLGRRHSQRVDTFIRDIIAAGQTGQVDISEDMREIWELFHDFMYESVYRNPLAKGEESKVENILRGIWEYYVRRPEKLPEDYRRLSERDGLERAVTDYVSGMTDDYAMYQYGQIFIPMAWSVK